MGKQICKIATHRFRFFRQSINLKVPIVSVLVMGLPQLYDFIVGQFVSSMPRLGDVMAWYLWVIIALLLLLGVVFEAFYRFANKGGVVIVDKPKYGLLDYRVLVPKTTEDLIHVLNKLPDETDKFGRQIAVLSQRMAEAKANHNRRLRIADRVAKEIDQMGKRTLKQWTKIHDAVSLLIIGYERLRAAGDPICHQDWQRLGNNLSETMEKVSGFRNALQKLRDQDLSIRITESSQRFANTMRDMYSEFERLQGLARTLS